MKNRAFKKINCLLIAASMIFSPAAVSGEVAAAEDLRLLTSAEKAQDIFDLVRPARKNETISEAYFRLSVRLDSEEQGFLSKKIGKNGVQKMPPLDLKKNTLKIFFPEKELSLSIDSQGSEKEVVSVNAKALSQKEVDSPERRWLLLEKMWNQSQNQKKSQSSFWWAPFLIPQADAFLENVSKWTWIGVGGMVLAAFIMYKKTKKSSTYQCTDSTPSCCFVNGTYVSHSNACCQQINGGLGIGSGATCPSTSTQTIDYVIPASSEGQK